MSKNQFMVSKFKALIFLTSLFLCVSVEYGLVMAAEYADTIRLANKITEILDLVFVKISPVCFVAPKRFSAFLCTSPPIQGMTLLSWLVQCGIYFYVLQKVLPIK